MMDSLKTVTIIVPSGYKDATEFLKDCEFQEGKEKVQKSAEKHDIIIKRLMNDLGQPNSTSLYLAMKQLLNEVIILG